MPLMNKNYVTPAWIDNAAPPINDDELNAMSQTLEGSQILVGNGAPTSYTLGKVGQRYADMSTSPPTIYELVEDGFPGQPIPQVQAATDVATSGFVVTLIGDYPNVHRAGASTGSNIIAASLGLQNTLLTFVYSSPTRNSSAFLTIRPGSVVYELELRNYDSSTKLYYAGISYQLSSQEIEQHKYDIKVPIFTTTEDALAAMAVPYKWKMVIDQNANTARPYSTGSSYAAGDYCIHGGKLWRALESTSGTWDGEKWEQARYAEDISLHVSKTDNPHHVTAAQTGALTGTVLATVQTTNIASRNYEAGEYFLFEGKLYVLKEDVPQGRDLFAENPEWDSGVTMLEFNKWYPMVNSVTQEPWVGHYIRIRTNTEEPGVARYWFVGGLQPNALHPVVAQHTEESLSYVYETCEGREPPQATYQAGFSITKYDGLTPDGWSYGFVSFTYWIEMLLYNTTPFVGTIEEMESLISDTQILTSEETELGNDVAALHPKTGSITLSATWTGSDPYSQTVTLSGATVTGKSKVDLAPTAAQLDALAQDGVISLLIENNGGTLTAWAVGAQPSASMTIACTVTETV